ncbi:MAG: acyloxyacyl hydrolase [Caulobacteraceae bacterium]
MVRAGSVALALSLLIAAPASAGEIILGGFAHDTSFGVSGTPHEGGTYDVQIGVRSHQFESLWWLLKPMVYAKAQLNTDDRTNFYTVGLEWRKHLFNTKFYGDFGVGGAYVDGFNTYPNDFQVGTGAPPAGSTAAQASQYYANLHVYNKFKAMGSDYVFNPNFTLGYDLTHNFSTEISWEHYSNAGFGGRNPGLDNFGARLVYHFAGPF